MQMFKFFLCVFFYSTATGGSNRKMLMANSVPSYIFMKLRDYYSSADSNMENRMLLIYSYSDIHVEFSHHRAP